MVVDVLSAGEGVIQCHGGDDVTKGGLQAHSQSQDKEMIYNRLVGRY